MCGFSGWYDTDGPERAVLESMTDALAHRGPDASGYFLQGPIGLGHRRLAVIDLAASVQPMASADKRYVLAYNGEIYNFRELRSELQSLGHVFRTGGDTEVVLEALIEWGELALPRLQGMFAFAFWDSHKETLLLARDHLGVKPLHIVWDGKRLLFASEIKALLAHPAVSREIDPQAIGLYLECQYIPAPFTIFQQIRKLPAAHYLRLKGSSLEEKCYWTPHYLPKFEFDEETALAELDAQLRRSVKSMMVSDVPLGAFVSGGIDSSLVAALMQQESGRTAKIFNIGFADNHSHSEHEYAASVASHLGAEHYPLFINTQDAMGALDHWVEIFDEPFGDQAALPTLMLSKFTRPQATVVLTGEGADEVFAGYSNYGKRIREASLCARLGGKYSPLPYLYRFLPAALRKERILKASARPLSRRYTTVPNLFDCELHASLLTPEFRRAQGFHLEHLAEQHYFSCDSSEYLDRMLHVDKRLWLADDLLAKVDRATMAYSLEARVPYLDHKLVEFTARLPPHMKLRNNTRKYLLRRLAEAHLPREIVFRSKQGFVLPLHEWLPKELKPMLDEALSPAGLLGRNIFRPGVIERMRRESASGRRSHDTRFWALLTLELWFRRYAPDYRCI